MGLYSSKNNYSYSDVAIDLDTVEESKFNSFDEAAIMAVVESEQNYNTLMKAVGIAELNYLEENGTEMVYTEGTASGFFAKVKEFFKKVLAKIASILKAFFAKIDSFSKSDKDFLNKYRKDLLKLNLKDMTVKGYKFTLTAPKTSVGEAEKAVHAVVTGADFAQIAAENNKEFLKSIVEKDEDDTIENTLEAYRGTVIDKSSKFDAGEYSKELFEHFRDNQSSKEEIDVDIVKEMQVLATSADTKKNAERIFKDQERLIKDIIKRLENAEKALLNDKSAEAEMQSLRIRAVNVSIKLYKGISDINTVAFGAYLQAMKDQSRQAKAICVKALTYKPKNESAGVEYGTTGSFLENVEFN